LKLENGDNCRQSVLLFCQSVLHSSIGLEDIEAAHTVRPRGNSPTDRGDTATQSTRGASNQLQDPIVVVRFSSQHIRDDIIKRRKLLKGTRQSITEDLTVLNISTLNRLRNHSLIDKCWSWNGKLFAIRKDGKKIVVNPYQSVEEALVLM